MSRLSMQQLGDIRIDSLEFAREGRRLAGDVPVHMLQRLTDVLADNGGTLAWVVHGEYDAGREPFLVIEVSGELHLVCQRCLAALPFNLNIKSILHLIAPGAAWPDEALEDDRADPIEALGEQPLLPLIEDEVLLAVPIAPRHESCMPPVHDDDSAALLPFAKLAQLMKH